MRFENNYVDKNNSLKINKFTVKSYMLLAATE
jgi:hypothetical protein